MSIVIISNCLVQVGDQVHTIECIFVHLSTFLVSSLMRLFHFLPYLSYISEIFVCPLFPPLSALTLSGQLIL